MYKLTITPSWHILWQETYLVKTHSTGDKPNCVSQFVIVPGIVLLQAINAAPYQIYLHSRLVYNLLYAFHSRRLDTLDTDAVLINKPVFNPCFC